MGTLWTYCVMFQENEKKNKELEILVKEQTQGKSDIKKKLEHELPSDPNQQTINDVLTRMSMEKLLESMLPSRALLSIGYIRENAFEQNNLNIPVSIVNYIIVFAFMSAESSEMYSLLHRYSDDRQLNNRLAHVLTRRSEEERQILIVEYREKYGWNLEQDIQILLRKGHSLHFIHGLLMTRA
eukprot:19678_1